MTRTSLLARSLLPVLLAGALAACSKGGGAEHGRYIVNIASCNNCHTVGFEETGPAVPEADRLTGVPVGYQGPWGVTYAPNLRLSAASMSEKDWVTMFKTRQSLPPMVWPALNAMTEADARAVYAYLKSLGPKGETMPTPLPPGVAPTTPYFEMMPKEP